MASARENELGVCGAIKLDFVDRPPWRDVIPFSSKCKYRGLDILHRHGAAIHEIVSVSEAVIEEQLAQILAVHSRRHARRIGKPGVEVGWGTRLAEKIALDKLGEDHLIGAKDRERSCHLPCIEKALDMHDVLEQGELAFIDEQHQLAGFFEIGLGGEQAETGKPVVVVSIHGRCGDSQNRTAQTVSDGVQLPAGDDLADRINGGHDPLASVVIE